MGFRWHRIANFSSERSKSWVSKRPIQSINLSMHFGTDQMWIHFVFDCFIYLRQILFSLLELYNVYWCWRPSRVGCCKYKLLHPFDLLQMNNIWWPQIIIINMYILLCLSACTFTRNKTNSNSKSPKAKFHFEHFFLFSFVFSAGCAAIWHRWIHWLARNCIKIHC